LDDCAYTNGGVAPFAGAWIETKYRAVSVFSGLRRAPHGRAWIETFRTANQRPTFPVALQTGRVRALGFFQEIS
jgi:hypothetical protein